MKESVSKFMAYVHTSVNQTSREYLSNERRYNYTTPKSFLEQIKLYGSLLSQKSKDLTTKSERLENGLQKLNSTSSQVVHPHQVAYRQYFHINSWLYSLNICLLLEYLSSESKTIRWLNTWLLAQFSMKHCL